MAPIMNERKAREILNDGFEFRGEEETGKIISQMEEAFKFATRNDLNSLRCDLANLMQQYYYVVARDDKRAEYMLMAFKKAKMDRDIEETVRPIYAQLMRKVSSTRNPNNELIESLKRFAHRFERFVETDNSGILRYIYQLIIVNAYYQNDVEKALEYCAQALELFGRKLRVKMQHIWIASQPGLLVKKQYGKALRYIRMAKNDNVGKRYNISVYITYEVFTLFHKGDYRQGALLVQEAEQNNYFNNDAFGQLMLFKAYTRILLNAGLIKKFPRYRVSSILNDVPQVTEDKQGSFIQILILYILLWIQEDKDKLISDYENLKGSMERNTVLGTRARTFLKMLLRIPKSHFDLSEIQKRNAADLKTFKQMPMNSWDIDIIPWEKLYEIAIHSIERVKAHQ